MTTFKKRWPKKKLKTNKTSETKITRKPAEQNQKYEVKKKSKQR